MEWFYFWCLIHIIDTNGNSSYIRLLLKNSSHKNENAVVFLNLYEQNNILGTILVTKQLLHDFHSMKKKGGENTFSSCMYFHFWVIYPFKISSYNSRNSYSLLHFSCMLRVNPNSLSYPFPLPLPLSFARSRESKGCPNSRFDWGVGVRRRGRYPLKPRIFASLLDTKGYPEHTTARSSREYFRLK